MDIRTRHMIQSEQLKIGNTSKKQELIISESLNIQLEVNKMFGLIGNNGI